VAQLSQLHIAQLFSWADPRQVPPPPPESGFLDLDGEARPVQELIYTGDFNIDFLQNQTYGDPLQRSNRAAFDELTPTEAQGGSNAPAAQPGAPPSPPPPPAVPFAGPFGGGRQIGAIGSQRLRAAVTTQATIFKRFPSLPKPAPAPLPVNPGETRSAAFDNFFYGGRQSAQAVVNFGPGNVDSGNVDDLTARIVRPGGVLPAGQIEVSGAAAFYGSRHAANRAPGLQVAAPPAALPLVERWIGANLVSDHVPVVLDIPCP
jgi:hypothetical protein